VESAALLGIQKMLRTFDQKGLTMIGTIQKLRSGNSQGATCSRLKSAGLCSILYILAACSVGVIARFLEHRCLQVTKPCKDYVPHMVLREACQSTCCQFNQAKEQYMVKLHVVRSWMHCRVLSRFGHSGKSNLSFTAAVQRYRRPDFVPTVP
jgi:hypothetical protein